MDWVDVATGDELAPGERIVFEVAHHVIALFNVEGDYYAVADVCTHDDGPLADGRLLGCEIECPRHYARFDLRDGSVTMPPAVRPLKIYPVRIKNGSVQIGLDDVN